MRYPAEFSNRARAAVEAELITSARDHDERKRQWNSHWPFPERQSLTTWILKVFLAYARAVIELGDRIWTVDEVRRQALEGLRLITLEISFKKDYHLFIESGSGHIRSETLREFAKSNEWREFEDDLLALATRQALSDDQNGSVPDAGPRTPKAEQRPSDAKEAPRPPRREQLPEQVFNDATAVSEQVVNGADAIGDLLIGGNDAVYEFANAARALEQIDSVVLVAALQPIMDAATAVEGFDSTSVGFRDALEATGCALEGIDVAAISRMFDTGATATGNLDFDVVSFTATAQVLQDLGVQVLKGIDLEDLSGAIAGLSDATRVVQVLAGQAQAVQRHLPVPESKPTSVFVSPNLERAPSANKGTPASIPDPTPEDLIDAYLEAHSEIPSHDVLAERIGISRDVLFAIKGETRWVRIVAYQSTAELIGCAERALHPRFLTRKRRKGKSNQQSDSETNQ
jgi:hypothetical protein